MYARVPQAMAQFVLKIEKLSHIMAPTPILEMTRAYGLHPRLWLLAVKDIKCLGGRDMMESISRSLKTFPKDELVGPSSLQRRRYFGAER